MDSPSFAAKFPMMLSCVVREDQERMWRKPQDKWGFGIEASHRSKSGNVITNQKPPSEVPQH